MAKKQKQNNKRRLLLLILLLVCALVLLGGATYAWFTANTKVAIEQMKLEVQVANGIEISADAVNWGPRVTLNELKKAAGLTIADTNEASKVSHIEDAGSVNQFPHYLDHVSSVGNLTEKNRLELINGVASNVCKKDGKLVGVKNDDYPEGIELDECDKDSTPTMGLVASSPYNEENISCDGDNCTTATKSILVAFDVYLKLDANTQVSLASGSYVNNFEGTDFGLKNTIRVAFITLGTQPADFYYADMADVAKADTAVDGLTSGEDPSGRLVKKDGDKIVFDTKEDKGEYGTLFGGYVGAYGARQMNALGNVNIWEPNKNSHSDSGVANAKYYGINDLGKEQEKDTDALHTAIPAEKLPITYAEASAAGSSGANKAYFATQKVYPAADTDAGVKNPINYFSSKVGSLSEVKPLFVGRRGVTKMRIYIWVEGNDVDTENSATSSQIEALLSFTTAGGTGEVAGTLKDDNTHFVKYTNKQDAVYHKDYAPTVPAGTFGVPTSTGTTGA